MRNSSAVAKVKPVFAIPKRRLSVRSDAESVRLRILTLWWNSWLADRELKITSGDVCDAVRDGVLPLQLLNALAVTDAPIPHPTPQSEKEVRANLRTLAARLRDAKVSLVSVSASRSASNIQLEGRNQAKATQHFVEELAAGNRSTVLILSWSLFLKFELQPMVVVPRHDGTHRWAEAEAPAAMAKLLEWVQAKTEGYRGVAFESTRLAWLRSFRDGHVFAALLHAHEPQLLSYDAVRCE